MAKLKILIEASVLALAETNPTARTGVFFVTINICHQLFARGDVELKFFIQGDESLYEVLYRGYKDSIFKDCLDCSSLKIGSEKIIIICPWNVPSPKLLEIPNVKVFQLVHDLAFLVCPEQRALATELQGEMFEFQKLLISYTRDGGYALCVSNHTRKDLMKLSGCPEDRIGVFYPGLKKGINDKTAGDEIDEKRIKSYLNIPVSASYVLVLSTVEPRKNIGTALKVFQEITQTSQSPDLYFVIVGDLKYWENLAADLESLPPEVREKGRLTGYMPDNYLPGLYRYALCLLYPSFYEGFGMPLVEAMACGTPVVASNRSSIPEVLGDATEVFDAYDYRGMAAKILSWYLCPEKRSQDGARAFERSKYFTWDKAIARIVNFIKEKSE